ncbi:uncharacterized protein DDB_G0284459-like [Oncorhynchus clarkii lewisi]|uniref:uncharacterized protein DDB_G0284459-like n=1 Tax=Oncorhynchus clarkii lewisi TaxID=490388 RepID=UPI0039B93313
MEKNDEESPGATGGEGDGRDITPVHNTGTPDGMAALGVMLQGFMLNQQQSMQQQQQSMQQAMQSMQQQMQQQISQLQEEVQKGKTKQQCVVTPLPAANSDTLTRPAPQSRDPAEEVSGEHVDKKEEAAEMKLEDVQQPLSDDESKPETDGSSEGNRETTKGAAEEVLGNHNDKKEEEERPHPEIPSPSKPLKGWEEKIHQGEQGKLKVGVD